MMLKKYSAILLPVHVTMRTKIFDHNYNNARNSRLGWRWNTSEERPTHEKTAEERAVSCVKLPAHTTRR